MKVSIVVPNLNYGRFLRNCLESIASQTYREIEVIMIDGGSSDQSNGIFEEFSRELSWTYHRRPGETQAASINYGLSEATGEIFCWLNSDDFYLDNRTIELVTGCFRRIPSMDVLSASGYYVDAVGHYLGQIRLNYHPLFRQDQAFRRGGGFCQPATYWRRRVSQKLQLDESFRYCFDSDFLLRTLKTFNVMMMQDFLLVGYRLHGTNLSSGVKPARVRELARLHRLHTNSRLRYCYLMGLACTISMVDRLPPRVANTAKRSIYIWNNLLSYFSLYRVPSI